MKKRLKYIYILFICIFIGIQSVYAKDIAINFKTNEIILGVGYSETLKYDLSKELNSSNIIWTSSNPKIATVNPHGKVTAISNGITHITAAINGESSSCKITVSNDYVAVKDISLNKTELNILINKSETLVATIYPANASNKYIIWESSDDTIATVDSNGQITAKKVGTAKIIASSNGAEEECNITVIDNIKLKEITLNKENITIKEQSSETLKVIYNPSDATNKKVTWKSSNNDIVKVDSNGKITGISPGSAVITAVSKDGGLVATSKVTVEALSKKVISVKLDKKELSLEAGKESTLKAIIDPDYAEIKDVTWKSSDEKIATVKDGIVTAIKKGTAEIKVITKDGNKEDICKVTVTSPPIKGIKFKETNQTIYINTQIKLETIADPINSEIENPIWTSSNEAVATVIDGIVIAKSLGETIINISNEDGTITSSTNIIVTEKPKEKLKISIEGYDLNFDPDKKNYDLKIGNESELNISTNIEYEKINIKGNRKLKDGSIITITVEDEEKITYVINIKKDKNFTILFIAIISVLLLLNLIRIFIKNKKNK